MNLEDQRLEAKLSHALRRENPPEGFAERVVLQARTAREKRWETPRPRFRLLWPAATLAAATALMLSISIEYRNLQEARAGRLTIQALQMASEELNSARDQILSK
jgi:hypothetical protein